MIENYDGKDYFYKKLCVENFARFSSVSRFVIPKGQRPYSWKNKKQLGIIDQLVKDTCYCYDQNIPKLFHDVVLATIDDDKKDLDSNQKYHLADGQQRITTLYILFAKIYNQLQNFKKESLFSPKDEYKIDDLCSRILKVLIYRSDSKRLYYRIEHRYQNNQLSFTTVMDKFLREDNKCQSNDTNSKNDKIIKVAEEIDKLINEKFRYNVEKDLNSLCEYTEYCLCNLFIVVKVTQNLGEAMNIYVDINTKFTPLQLSEKAKILSFKLVEKYYSDLDLPNSEKLISNKLDEIEGRFKKLEKILGKTSINQSVDEVSKIIIMYELITNECCNVYAGKDSHIYITKDYTKCPFIQENLFNKLEQIAHWTSKLKSKNENKGIIKTNIPYRYISTLHQALMFMLKNNIEEDQFNEFTKAIQTHIYYNLITNTQANASWTQLGNIKRDVFRLLSKSITFEYFMTKFKNNLIKKARNDLNEIEMVNEKYLNTIKLESKKIILKHLGYFQDIKKEEEEQLKKKHKNRQKDFKDALKELEDNNINFALELLKEALIPLQEKEDSNIFRNLLDEKFGWNYLNEKYPG